MAIELKQKDLDCINLFHLIQHEHWHIIEDLIKTNINEAKDRVFDSKGEVADYDRGGGQYLLDFLTELEDMVTIGQKLSDESRSGPNKE